MQDSELRTEDAVLNSEVEVMVKKVELLKAMQGSDESEPSYEEMEEGDKEDSIVTVEYLR